MDGRRRDQCRGSCRVVREIGILCRAHGASKGFLPCGCFDEELFKILCESLTQPEVIPVRFRHGIAEPLVGDLMGGEAFEISSLPDGMFIEEDGARILHSTIHCGGFDERKFLVGIGSYQPVEDGEDLGRAAVIAAGLLPVSGVEIVEDGSPFHRSLIRCGKLCSSEDHAIGRNRDRLAPVPEFPVFRQHHHLLKATVADDVEPERRCDDTFYGGLVVGVIHGGEPVACTIGPVVGED